MSIDDVCKPQTFEPSMRIVRCKVCERSNWHMILWVHPYQNWVQCLVVFNPGMVLRFPLPLLMNCQKTKCRCARQFQSSPSSRLRFPPISQRLRACIDWRAALRLRRSVLNPISVWLPLIPSSLRSGSFLTPSPDLPPGSCLIETTSLSTSTSFPHSKMTNISLLAIVSPASCPASSAGPNDVS